MTQNDSNAKHVINLAGRRVRPRVLSYALMMALLVGAGSCLSIDQASQARASSEVMLILRGVANAGNPRGQLDDASALEYADRLGYQGEVLDVAGNGSAQVGIALDRIRSDERVTAIYGFSGGGYNTRRIWSRLSADERHRIEKIVVLGAPGVNQKDFPGSKDVLVKRDPPAGHMAGPKTLLLSLDPG